MVTALQTCDIGELTNNDAAMSDKRQAITTIILQVNRIIDYPLQVVTP